MKVKDEFDIFFTVHAIKVLTLFGFGGSTGRGKWAEPYTTWYGGTPPETKLFNIVVQDRIRPDITDSEIGKLVRGYSNRLSNAFAISTSRCYN